MKRALQPVISDVSIAWDLAKDWTVHQFPSSLPPLFSGDRLVVFGLLKSSHGNDTGEAAVADKEAKSHVRQTKKKVEEQNKGLAMLEN